MANFTIADIKALREQLGTGMVDTKKALEGLTATSRRPSRSCASRAPRATPSAPTAPPARASSPPARPRAP